MSIRFVSASLIVLSVQLCALTVRAEPTESSSPVFFGPGIEFRDPEKRYTTFMRFRAQNLLGYQTQNAQDLDAAQVTTQVRRLRFRLGGWMLDPRITYNLQLSFSRGDQDWSDSSFPNIIRDAAISYRLTPDLRLSFGQTKLPGNRQRVVSSGELQFPDRSIVNRAFNLDRDFHIQAIWQPETQDSQAFAWSLKAALGSGRGRNASPQPWGYVGVARIEALPWGVFTDQGDYFEGDLAHEGTPKLSVALGAATHRNATRTGGTVGATLAENKSFATLIADAVLKYRGLSLSAEYLAREVSGSPQDSLGENVLEGHGMNFQAGYFVSQNWELAARTSFLRPSTSLMGLANDQTQYTLGVSRYLRGHRLKVQSDLTRNQQTSNDHWIARFQVELGV